MDVEVLKSAPFEDEMEMMLMMHMEKLPGGGNCGGDDEFSGGDIFSDVNNMQVMAMDFSSYPQGIIDTISNNSSGSPRPPPVHQEPPRGAQPFLPEPCGRYQTTAVSGGIYPPAKSTPAPARSMAAVREMIFRIAAMQPIHIEPESVKPPKRRNVRISTDPQSVAARHRRERISEKIRTLQRLVPGGTKMDTASMLDEAIHYVKFLKNQVQNLERSGAGACRRSAGIGFPVAGTAASGGDYLPASTQGCHNNYS